MVVGEIKAQMARALREKDEVVRNVLGVALGEIQTAEARANRALSEDEAIAVVRKIVKSNEETLALGGSEGDRAAALRREIEVLTALLPKGLSVDEIAVSLVAAEGVAEAVRSAKNDGQAMGAAMKHLKASGAVVQATDVQQAVRRLRG
jgi:uncharacterized protein YqeY